MKLIASCKVVLSAIFRAVSAACSYVTNLIGRLRSKSDTQ